MGADRFATCAQQVVEYLDARTPMNSWSVSRIAGGEQVHVHVTGDAIARGTRLEWPLTFCHSMTGGAASVVPDTLADPDYAHLQLSQQLRGYAGVPIRDDDGQLFGMLCGVSLKTLPSPDVVDPALLMVFSSLLAELLAAVRTEDRGMRQMEVSQALSDVDALTQLFNRRGWDKLVDDAQQRINAFGDLVSVAVIDLDGLKQINDSSGHQAGDELLCRAGAVLIGQERLGDRIARYGGDEFAVLSNNVPVAELETYFLRLHRALNDAGIQCSIGWSLCAPGSTVLDSFAAADSAMYEMKRRNRLTTA